MLSEVNGNIFWLRGSHLAAPPRELRQSCRAEYPNLCKGYQDADSSSLCPSLSAPALLALEQSRGHPMLTSAAASQCPGPAPGQDSSCRKIKRNEECKHHSAFPVVQEISTFGTKPFLSSSDREVENDLLLGAQPGFLRKQQIKCCKSNEGWHWGRVGVWLLLCSTLLPLLFQLELPPTM